MAQHLALFIRGINVGKHSRITMDDLKNVMAKSNFGEIETYLQSGNLRIESDDDPEEVATRAEAALQRYGIKSASVVAIPWKRLESFVKKSPFSDLDPSLQRGLVVFLRHPSNHAKQMRGEHGGLNIVASEKDVLFGSVFLGMTHALNFKKSLEKPLGTLTTARFWNVIEDWVCKKRSGK